MLPAIFNIERESHGELLFAWSSFILYIIYKYTDNVLYFYIPFSMVVFADSIAALTGKKFPISHLKFFNKKKSYGGTLAFFTASFILSYYFFSKIKLNHIFLISFINAFVLTIVEATSVKGYDNIFISIISGIFFIFDPITKIQHKQTNYPLSIPINFPTWYLIIFQLFRRITPGIAIADLFPFSPWESDGPAK